MEATVCDLDDTRGDNVIVTLEFADENDAPLDLTDYVFASQLRIFEDDTVAIDFVVDDSQQASGTVILKIPKATAQELKQSYAWDLEVTDPDGNVDTWLRGKFEFDKDTTRP